MKNGRIILQNDCPEINWKNGGGTTREIVSFPPNAGFDEFKWRLSAARIEKPGAFSRFANVDRTLAVIDGALSLAVADASVHRLDRMSTPFRFSGDDVTIGKPIGGAVSGLNLMVRRGQAKAEMRRISEGRVSVREGTAILFALQDSHIGVGPCTIALMANDSYEFDARQDQKISIDRPALLVLIQPEIR